LSKAGAGIRAENTAKMLFEHTQRDAAHKAEVWWQERYAIRPGALVVLDEAGMASRQVIDELQGLCAAAGANLLAVGDHEQLASPEAGGAFRLIVERAGAATLAEVRRFDAK